MMIYTAALVVKDQRIMEANNAIRPPPLSTTNREEDAKALKGPQQRASDSSFELTRRTRGVVVWLPLKMSLLGTVVFAKHLEDWVRGSIPLLEQGTPSQFRLKIRFLRDGWVPFMGEGYTVITLGVGVLSCMAAFISS